MADIIPGTCAQCQATGLPILPVRYAVVPRNVRPALPGWASGERVSSVDVGSDFQYALRLARTGYIYVFYEKNARGNHQWECYSVGQDGSLTRFMEWRHARPQETPELRCTRHGPVNTQVHYLVIEQPEKCATAWIAFTQDLWSEDTVREYTRNTSLRNARMQTLHPAKMIAGAKHPHGAIASKETLEQVLEYSPTLSTVTLPYDGHTGQAGQVKQTVGTLSHEDGSVIDGRLEKMSTRYPWALRPERAEATALHMQGRAKAEGGKPGTPHVLALWDAVGMAHELNGFRNDAAGWIARYGDERALQLTALNTYDGLQKALENRAQVEGEDYIRRGVEDGPLQEGQRELEEKLKVSPDDAYLQEQLRNMRALSSQLAVSAPQIGDQFGKSLVQQAWPKYQNCIDAKALRSFKDNFDKFQMAAADLVEQRTPPLIRWLEAQLFLDTLNDFHGDNIEDGMLCDEAIGGALLGIGSCTSGKKKIDEWVKDAKASNKGNLLWRAMALNQDAARAELDAVLAEAAQHKAQQTQASAIAWLGYTAKSMKAVADTYKKAQGVLDGNLKAAGGATAFGARIKAVNMRGVDQAVVAFGDAVFRHFRIDTLADFASEKIIQHLFSIRAFVDPADSANLIMAQAREEELLRNATLKRLRTARSFMAADTPAIRTAQSEYLGAAWSRFKSDTSTASKAQTVASAMKDARLALVVGLIEGVNFAKLIADCIQKGDTKSWLSLLASGMSITSALFDIGTVAAKNLPEMGSASWTYQGLKMWGGVLSGGATFVGAVLDFSDGLKTDEKGYGLLGMLYYAKSGIGFGSVGLSAAVTFSYAAPLIGRLTGNAVVGTAVKEVGRRAAAVIGFRILGMAAGGWITVGLFGIQVAVWVATPNALEDWMDHSAFGKKRSTGGFKTAEEQEKWLRESLVELGLQ